MNQSTETVAVPLIFGAHELVEVVTLPVHHRSFSSVRERRDFLLGGVMLYMLKSFFGTTEKNNERLIFEVADSSEPALIARYVAAFHANDWLAMSTPVSVAAALADELMPTFKSNPDAPPSFAVYLNQDTASMLDRAADLIRSLAAKGYTSEAVRGFEFEQINDIYGGGFENNPDNQRLFFVMQAVLNEQSRAIAASRNVIDRADLILWNLTDCCGLSIDEIASEGFSFSDAAQAISNANRGELEANSDNHAAWRLIKGTLNSTKMQFAN